MVLTTWVIGEPVTVIDRYTYDSRDPCQHHKFFCLYLLSIFSENWGQSQKDMIVLKQSDCGDHQAISDTKLTLTRDALTEIIGVGDLLYTTFKIKGFL